MIANAENAAGGSGLTPKIYDELIAAGVDCITMGDHIYRRREIDAVLKREQNIVKPANFPAGRARSRLGRRAGRQRCGRGRVQPAGTALHAPGRLPLDARRSGARGDSRQHVPVRVLDFHAEATSEKQLMGRYLDGRVSAVLGTHTHVPTADEQILPGGTAFQSDVGMTGPCESILGRDIDRVMHTTITFRPTYFQVAKRRRRDSAGRSSTVDPATGKPSVFAESSCGKMRPIDSSCSPRPTACAGRNRPLRASRASARRRLRRSRNLPPCCSRRSSSRCARPASR